MTRPLLLSLLALACFTLNLSAQDAHIRVLPEVKQPDPGRIGINLGHIGYTPWNSPSSNFWMRGGGLNGTIVRLKLDVGGTAAERRDGAKFEAGPDFITQSQGLGYYDAFRTGFWDGADYIAYRFDPEAESARVVRQGKIKRFINPGPDKQGQSLVQRMEFDGPGEPLKVGDEIVLTMVRHNWKPEEFRVGLDGTGFGWDKMDVLDGGPISYDTSTHAPLPGSDSSLRLDAKAGFELAQNYLGNQRDYWIKLPEDKTFVFSVWMKHEGEGPAEVSVDVATIASHKFQVTPEWKEYRFTFSSAHPKGAVRQLTIKGAAGGTYWMDGVQIYSEGAEPGALMPEAMAALKALRPGVLRIWALQTNSTHGETLDNALLPPATRRMQFVRNRGGETPDGASLPQELAVAEAVGANPWIIVNVAFSPEEWRNLIEFLAGPEDSPYGRKRAEAGHPRPYTEVFDKIHLELGNEIWSRIFAPWTWNNEPIKAAQYARLMWEAAKSSPYFNSDKIAFNGPGWSANIASRGETSYGARFAKHNPLSSYHSGAYYAGGFDGVSLAESDNRAEQVRNRLFYLPRIHGPMLETHAKADASTRPGLRPAIYEGGPGYALPGPGQVFTEEQEAIGKSLASAITTLDEYLHAQSLGFGPIAHFVFGNSGYNWSAYNPEWVPSLPLLAVQMRNEHAAGDLMKTEAVKVPTVDLPEAVIASGGHGANRKETPLPAAPATPTLVSHAFREGKQWSVVLISREPEASRKVRLDLPFTPQSAYTEVRLQNEDPLATNRTGLTVTPVSTEKTGASPTMTVEMPPHSIAIFKFTE